MAHCIIWPIWNKENHSMKKKKYEIPDLLIILFNADDIITDSGFGDDFGDEPGDDSEFFDD